MNGMFELTALDISNDIDEPLLIDSVHDEIKLLDLDYVLDFLNYHSDYSEIEEIVIAKHPTDHSTFFIYGILTDIDGSKMVDDTTYAEISLQDIKPEHVSFIYNVKTLDGFMALQDAEQLEKYTREAFMAYAKDFAGTGSASKYVKLNAYALLLQTNIYNAALKKQEFKSTNVFGDMI